MESSRESDKPRLVIKQRNPSRLDDTAIIVALIAKASGAAFKTKKVHVKGPVRIRIDNGTKVIGRHGNIVPSGGPKRVVVLKDFKVIGPADIKAHKGTRSGEAHSKVFKVAGFVVNSATTVKVIGERINLSEPLPRVVDVHGFFVPGPVSLKSAGGSRVVTGSRKIKAKKRRRDTEDTGPREK